jgi:hypothetical protein
MLEGSPQTYLHDPIIAYLKERNVKINLRTPIRDLPHEASDCKGGRGGEGEEKGRGEGRGARQSTLEGWGRRAAVRACRMRRAAAEQSWGREGGWGGGDRREVGRTSIRDGPHEESEPDPRNLASTASRTRPPSTPPSRTSSALRPSPA